MNNFAASVAENLVADLSARSDEERRLRDHRYFKYPLKSLLGCDHDAIKKTVARFLPDLAEMPSSDILETAEKLLKYSFLECQIAASEIMGRTVRKLDPSLTLMKTERWMLDGFIDNWAPADSLANGVLSRFIMENESLSGILLSWTNAANIWLRRSAAVAHVVPAGAGRSLDNLYEIARRLLRDENEYVKKGLGWALREAAKADKPRFVEFADTHGGDMSRITLRYAVEKFPSDERDAILKRTKLTRKTNFRAARI